MAGLPSRNHICRERIVHGGCTGVHQGGEGGKALGKVAHCLGGLLLVCLCRVLICGRGVQHADDGGKHQKGVGAEVDGEEVLSHCQTGGVCLEMVCTRWHLNEGIGRLAPSLCHNDHGSCGVLPGL